MARVERGARCSDPGVSPGFSYQTLSLRFDRESRGVEVARDTTTLRVDAEHGSIRTTSSPKASPRGHYVVDGSLIDAASGATIATIAVDPAVVDAYLERNVESAR